VISEHLCVAQSAYHLDLLLAQILVQHIRAILPDLKARISTQIIMLQKELASYGEVTDSKSGQGALLLNIITKYSYGKTCFFVFQLILTCMVDPAITF
jgi:hypothetical protein